ncbi:MAG: cation:proton antiporter, partial [Cyanobacteria bacterium REEB65]|nr:cation:proton antiporter [Cyanobacteria bacterium REEB65]
ALGLPAGWLSSHAVNPLIDLALTLVVSYGGFTLAQEGGVSGVLCVATLGLCMGTMTRRRRDRRPQADVIDRLWRNIGLGANVVLFFLVGVTLAKDQVGLDAIGVGWLVLAMLVARGSAVAAIGAFQKLSGSASFVALVRWPKLSYGQMFVLLWGGLRGALSLALALSLPTGWPYRLPFVPLVSGCVFFSLVIQGLTAPFLVRRLAMVGVDLA